MSECQKSRAWPIMDPSPWGGQGYVSVHKPTASCLTQIRETLSTGGGQRGLD